MSARFQITAGLEPRRAKIGRGCLFVGPRLRKTLVGGLLAGRFSTRSWDDARHLLRTLVRPKDVSRFRRGSLVLSLLCGLLLTVVQTVWAGSAVVYSQALLESRAPVYQHDIRVNLDAALLDFLTPEEAIRLGEVRLEVPVRGGLAGHRAERRGRLGVVVMPAESLRFFSDLCTASAWLAARGYSLSTIADYLNMLKYGDPASLGRTSMPLPLEALQVPEGELDEPGVENRRSACFSTGVVFILAHELGHLILGHQGYEGVSPRETQANEAAADAFAVELMSRAGDLPLGALYYFTYMSYLERHRGDFVNDAAWQDHLRRATHPISPDRVEALAASLRKHARRFAAGPAAAYSLAEQIAPIADALTDTDIQQLRRLQGLSVRPFMLAPRRGDVWMVESPDPPLPRQSFSGHFTGWIGPSEAGSVPTALLLMRDGDRVTGRYSYAGIGGSLSGRIEDGVLRYRFSEPGAEGRGEMRSQDQGDRLAGGYRTEQGGRGLFEVWRQ